MYVLLIIAIYSDSCVEKTLIYYPHITKKCDICDMIQIETIFDILVKGFIIGVVVSAPLGPVSKAYAISLKEAPSPVTKPYQRPLFKVL